MPGAQDEKKEPSMADLVKLVQTLSAQVNDLKGQKSGIDAGTMSQLVQTIKDQGEELKKLRELQEEYREQYDRDMAGGVKLQSIPYEDIASRQEKEAERLALEITPTTHQAATSLLRKIKNRLTGNTWDHIAEGLVKTYQLGKKPGAAKDKAEEFKALKDELKSIVVDPRTASGRFRTGRKVQSTTWAEVERTLDNHFKAGSSAPAAL